MEGGALRRRTKVRRCGHKVELAEFAAPLVHPSVERTYLALPLLGYPLSATGAGSCKPGATPQGRICVKRRAPKARISHGADKSRFQRWPFSSYWRTRGVAPG